MPLRRMSASANSSSASICSRVVGQPRRERVERRDLGARAPREDVDEPDVVDVLVGDDDQPEVLDPVPAVAQRPLELVERLAAVRAGVDQRQRVVLDEVRVDAPDRERRRDRDAVDAVGVQERMSPSTSSRRRSMSSRETSDLEVQAQQRLGVRRAHVEVPVVVVDRDAVELVDRRRRRTAPRSPRIFASASSTVELISPEMKYFER